MHVSLSLFVCHRRRRCRGNNLVTETDYKKKKKNWTKKNKCWLSPEAIAATCSEEGGRETEKKKVREQQCDGVTVCITPAVHTSDTPECRSVRSSSSSFTRFIFSMLLLPLRPSPQPPTPTSSGCGGFGCSKWNKGWWKKENPPLP